MKLRRLCTYNLLTAWPECKSGARPEWTILSTTICRTSLLLQQQLQAAAEEVAADMEVVNVVDAAAVEKTLLQAAVDVENRNQHRNVANRQQEELACQQNH